MSTGAPGSRPRTDSSNTVTQSFTDVSGSLIASARVPNKVKSVLASAGADTNIPGGVWNAIPPRIIVARASVWTLNPVASSVTSMPLACQKRVFVVTY